MSRLPIDIAVPQSTPLRFKWRYRLPESNIVQECEGAMIPSMEAPLANLIQLAHRLQKENKELWDRVEEMGKKLAEPVVEQVAATKGKK